MIICSCNVLSDHQIRAVLRTNGARMTSQIYGCLGCNPRCGRCARTIRRIMDQLKSPCSGDCSCCPRALANDAVGVDATDAPAFA